MSIAYFITIVSYVYLYISLIRLFFSVRLFIVINGSQIMRLPHYSVFHSLEYQCLMQTKQ